MARIWRRKAPALSDVIDAVPAGGIRGVGNKLPAEGGKYPQHQAQHRAEGDDGAGGLAFGRVGQRSSASKLCWFCRSSNRLKPINGGLQARNIGVGLSRYEHVNDAAQGGR